MARTVLEDARKVDDLVRQQIDGTQETQIVGGSLPLPSGAATEATLALVKAKTDNLDVPLSTVSGGQAPCASSAVTSVTASLTNVTLLAANVARRGAVIFNDTSTGILYVKMGATASVSSFTIRLAPQSMFEVPFGYVGVIDGIWLAIDGVARVTELTP